MKTLLKPVLLTFFLSLFVLGDSAEAQIFRRARRDPVDSVGRNQHIPDEPRQPIQNSPPIQQPPQSPPVPPQPLRQYQPPNNSGNTRGGTVNASQRFRLVIGDVILEINGERINGQEDVTSAIARSPQTMYLTVQDGRTGISALYVTTLHSSRPRLGITHLTAPGGGSRITGVNPNSPATRCYLVE